MEITNEVLRELPMSFVITIDGPAASGKSSVSRELAKRLKCHWVSTGSFYRGLAYVATQLNVDFDDEQKLAELAVSNIWSVVVSPEKTRVLFRGVDVTDAAHDESIGNVASIVSQYPLVRQKLLEPQRRCQTIEGLVAEGRDCGSVVFPNANLKIYLTADSDNRALRRAQEKGLAKDDIQKLQKFRDNQDLTRLVAPLKAADGSHTIDTSALNLNQVVDVIENLTKSVL